MTRGFVRLNVDKTFYIAGDIVNGPVKVQSDKIVKIRSLDVFILGEEKVVIDPPVYAAGAYHKASYSSTNDMLNTGLQLLENTTIGPEEKDLAFEFQIPPNALPSYIRGYARVVWKLQARTDVPWGSDLNDEGYLRVLAVQPAASGPFVAENQEASPRLRLNVQNNILEPGETVQGSLTLLEPGNLRSVRMQVIQNEDAMARGTFTDAHKVQNRNVTPTNWLRGDQLSLNTPIYFQITIPDQATSNYRGIYSAVSYFVEVIMDIPHANDIHLYAPLFIGVKARPSPQPSLPAPTQVQQQQAVPLLSVPAPVTDDDSTPGQPASV